MPTDSTTEDVPSKEPPFDPLPPKPPKRKSTPAVQKTTRSPACDHFHVIETDDLEHPRVACNYCDKSYACQSKGNGTSNMLRHVFKKCKKYPGRKVDDSQQTLSLRPSNARNQLVATTFSVEACRIALAKMIIIDELSFRFVEGEGFRYFMSIAQPKFNPIPSRTTIAKDCIKIYIEEKRKLKNAIRGKRICITTDKWTSVQNLSYMCVTAHFIDDEWNLQKRILNFCQIPNHKGETIGKRLEICFLDWGVDSIFTITVDNAGSNNTAIDYLVRKTKHWDNTVLNHKYIHVRCSAHVLNLVVRSGLEDVNPPIVRVRNAVRYVRSSPARLARFKSCVAVEKIASEKLVCLDVPTRWNSTYVMLEVAEKFQRAFERLQDEDGLQYTYYFGEDGKKEAERSEWQDQVAVSEVGSKRGGKKVLGPPNITDWEEIRVFMKFLRMFYNATLRVSGTLYVTSNAFFHEFFLIEKKLVELGKNPDRRISLMAERMKKKYDSYWSLQKCNMLLYVAVVLDPRYKLEYVFFCFKELYGEEKAKVLKKHVEQNLEAIYEWYNIHYATPSSFTPSQNETQSQISDAMEVDREDDDISAVLSNFQKHLEDNNKSGNSSELEKYLAEACEKGAKDFDILGWWKYNSSRFSILSLVARDVLAMPVSSVASESAFSTGGRILDPFRSSLGPNTVEALVCTRDWLRSSHISMNLRQYMDDVEAMDKIDAEAFNSAMNIEPLVVDE